MNTIVLSAALLSIILLIASIIFFSVNHIPKATVEEVTSAAENLIVRNFNTAYYYGISSLTPDAEYNPEDYPEGYAPCDDDIFPDSDSLIKYITGTYVSEEAARIVALKTPDGRARYSSVNGELCMAVVDGDISYDKDFAGATYRIENIEKDSADLIVTVPSKSTDEKYLLNLSMVKVGENWLLKELVY